jgi:hypothetical protein
MHPFQGINLRPGPKHGGFKQIRGNRRMPQLGGPFNHGFVFPGDPQVKPFHFDGIQSIR